MGINESGRQCNSAGVDFAAGGNGITHRAYPSAFDSDVSFKWLSTETVVDGCISNEQIGAQVESIADGLNPLANLGMDVTSDWFRLNPNRSSLGFDMK